MCRCVLAGSHEVPRVLLSLARLRVFQAFAALVDSSYCDAFVPSGFSMFGLGGGPANSCVVVFWELFDSVVLPSPFLLTYTR